MNKKYLKCVTLVLTLLITTLLQAKSKVNYPTGSVPKSLAGLTFTENKGQVHDQYYKARPDVLFSGTDGDLVFHLKNNGLSYQLSRVDKWKETIDERTKEKRKEIDKSTIYRLDINWLNANTNARITKGEANEGYNNYYLESCPDGALNVKSYEDVTYHNIYSGIDLKWYAKDGHLKYDYIVAAGADYKQIQLELKGARNISINAIGELVIETPLGKIIEQAPIVTQKGKVRISKWVLARNVLSYEIEDLNRDEEFVIDPAVRTWGTYYGGIQTDEAKCCNTDIAGNVYIAGQTTSSAANVIATIGSHQYTYAGGSIDAYLVKFNAAGVRQWGTYYGGAGLDMGHSCCTDNLGNVYMAGRTSSGTGTVIATAGSHQPVISGSPDAFLVKFNSAGVRQWGTYYGGIGADYGNSCCTDASGNVYMCGETASGNDTSIATVGSHQTIFGGAGYLDAFLVKFNSAGVRQWGTYYGGTDAETGNSCCTDASGNVFLTGYTLSGTGTVIATAGSHQPIFGGYHDAFLVKFNSVGVRQWGTYYGGIGIDQGYGCTTDAMGYIYMLGVTESNAGTEIATPGSHQPTLGGGTYDLFLVKFNPGGTREWGTYYGGNSSEYGGACVADGMGNIYIVGHTNSPNGNTIATAGSHQPIFGGGAYEAFLVKFNSTGVRQWGTYYGGNGDDEGMGCSVDTSGNIYMCGKTVSNNGNTIATAGSHQPTKIGAPTDGFLVQFYECTPAAPMNTTPAANLSICNGNITQLNASGAGNLGWYSALIGGLYLGGGANFTTPALFATTTFYVQDSTCSAGPRTPVIVTVNIAITASQTVSLCAGQSITVGANTYNTTGIYTDTFIAANGCDSVFTTNLTVNPVITSSQIITLCAGQSIIVGANTYNATGIYTDTFIAANGCDSIFTTNLTVNTINTATAINGTTITSNQTGASYQWIDCNNANLPISGEINQSFTAIVNGSYAVIVTVGNCADTSNCVLINSVGISETDKSNSIDIYPNPTNDRIFIVSGEANLTVKIYNSVGSLLYEGKMEKEMDEIDLSHLAKGVYFIHIGSFSRKIIKK